MNSKKKDLQDGAARKFLKERGREWSRREMESGVEYRLST